MTTATSFDALFNGGALARDSIPTPEPSVHRASRLDRPLDRDELRGKIDRPKRSDGGGPSLSGRLDRRLGVARRFGFRAARAPNGDDFDPRQRAVVKLHFFGHGGGGGAALLAHGRYVARDAATRDRQSLETARGDEGDGKDREARSHLHYLSRHDRSARFYDGLGDEVDGLARMAVWTREDKRHFRIILAPENGTELGDLRPYVRAVMDRAEARLGRLEWVAIDHHDTDNPHTHIVLRGRHANGRALILPRDFVKQGLRDIARDEATQRIGQRTRAQEQAALLREARAHRPTRLDRMLAHQMNGDELRISSLRASNGDPATTKALKARARELERLGLASARRRNVLVFHEGWRDRLGDLELHLDIRKRLVLERTQQRDISKTISGPPPRGLER